MLPVLVFLIEILIMCGKLQRYLFVCELSDGVWWQRCDTIDMNKVSATWKMLYHYLQCQLAAIEWHLTCLKSGCQGKKATKESDSAEEDADVRRRHGVREILRCTQRQWLQRLRLSSASVTLAAAAHNIYECNQCCRACEFWLWRCQLANAISATLKAKTPWLSLSLTNR